MRVSITHDFMDVYGGAERVTQEMARAFPDATVTAILGRRSVAARMGVEERFTSFLPARKRLLGHYRELAPVLPAAIRGRPLPPADVLLSSSYAFAHLFRTANHAPQVCYCHSPLRFAWSMTDAYEDRRARGAPARAAFRAFAGAMRGIDRRAAAGVDAYLTQSPYVGDQIESFYGRKAEIAGAPIDCDLFRPSGRPPEDFYLLCGRLIEPYKRMGLVVRAFAEFPGERLVIAGDGPAMAELRALAGPNVEFVGQLGDAELVDAMQRCKAALFPSQDDFGLIPVEVMACGRPVLAYRGGGAQYTVVAGRTGELFAEQDAAVFADALRAFDPGRYDADEIRRHALQWDSAAFRERLVEAVARVA